VQKQDRCLGAKQSGRDGEEHSGDVRQRDSPVRPTAAGNANGSVSIVSKAGGSPATISLTGTGVAPVPYSVALSWTASTSNHIWVQRVPGTVSGGPYAKFDSSLAATLSYTDTTVQSGTTYYYLATVVDSSGDQSVYSNDVPAPIS
jgi:hypothetical protein